MTTPTRVADRAAEQAVLGWDFDNVDDDQGLVLELPAGFGDCLILEGCIDVASIATAVALDGAIGCSWVMADTSDSIRRDFLGCEQWYRSGSTRAVTRVSPDPLVVWKATEFIFVTFPELDSNATPTADLKVLVKVRRIRQTSPDRLISPVEGGPHFVTDFR